MLSPLTHSHNPHSKPVTQSKIFLIYQVPLTWLVIPSSNSSLFLTHLTFSFPGYFGFAHQHFGSTSFRRPSQTSVFLLKCSVALHLVPVPFLVWFHPGNHRSSHSPEPFQRSISLPGTPSYYGSFNHNLSCFHWFHCFGICTPKLKWQLMTPRMGCSSWHYLVSQVLRIKYESFLLSNAKKSRNTHASLSCIVL